MDKTIKKWNIETRYQGSSKTVATVIPDGWVQRSDYTTTVITGWSGDVAQEIEQYNRDIDWDNGEMTTYELSYNTELPLSSLTIKVGSAFLPKEGEWREPIPLGYGFYLCGVETNKDEDYYKVHEPWKPNTVNGDSLFRLCDWLREWDFAMPMLENGRYMFSGTYMRKFRDPSIWHTALSRLSDGEYMFDKCSLDLESIRIIATQVPDWSQDLDTQHKLHLGIDYNIQGDTQLQEYLDLLVTKGWVLTITYLNLGY